MYASCMYVVVLNIWVGPVPIYYAYGQVYLYLDYCYLGVTYYQDFVYMFTVELLDHQLIKNNNVY